MQYWIFFFVGIFDWGIKGAALATGLALASACLVMLPALLSKKNIVNLHGGKFSFKLIGEMLYNGSSEGLSELSAGITVFLFNWAMMTSLGENGVAAFTAVNYILYLGVQLFVGLSDGIIPILSYNFGAGNHERMKKTLVMGYRTNAFIGAIFFSLMFFSGEFIVRFFFNSSDGSNIEEIIDISSTGAAFVASAFILNGANILSSSFFTSMGEAKTSVVISLLRGLVLIAAGIVIWPFIFGENGLWVVIPAAETLTSIYCLYILRKKVSWN